MFFIIFMEVEISFLQSQISDRFGRLNSSLHIALLALMTFSAVDNVLFRLKLGSESFLLIGFVRVEGCGHIDSFKPFFVLAKHNRFRVAQVRDVQFVV